MPVEDDIEEIKERLRTYDKSQIRFNELHFTNQLMLRDGNRRLVIDLLLNPSRLVYSYKERGRRGDTIHCLHFRISRTRTIRLPVIFTESPRKSLYILTYIMRYRNWQSMIRK